MNALFAYQCGDQGVGFLIKPQARLRSWNRLLAWEEGSGKTPVAVVGADAIGAKRVLVICPPIALGVWDEHFRSWSQLDRKIVIVEERNPTLPEGDCVCVIAYSRVWSLEREIVKTRWDLLILDETHFIKSSLAQRTRAIYGRDIKPGAGIAGRADRVWCLTGTPVLNHALDLYPHLKALAPELLYYQGARVMSEEQFTERFCVTRNARFGPRIVGSKNTEELHARLKPFMSRVRKRDLGLPPLTFVSFPLPPDIVIPAPLKAEISAALARAGVTDIANDDEFLAALHADQANGGVIRRLLGVAKAPHVAELVEDLLAKDPDRKVLVFAHHRDVIGVLERLLRPHGAIVIDGSVDPMERTVRVRLFQQSPRVRVGVLNIVAAGTAATMHASDEVVFAEASWVPNENNQAAARAHRVGQTKSVTARFVVLPKTVDERIQATLARKSREIAQIVDGQREKPPRSKLTREMYDQLA